MTNAQAALPFIRETFRQLGAGGLMEGDDVGRRFLDRAAGHVDDRPAVAFA